VRVDVENMDNGSAVKALWALSAPEPKKRLKWPDARVGGVVERLPKTGPKGAVFCRLSTGTET
jgi:hypothetical protein